MARSRVRLIERLESYVIPLIQQEGADKQVVGFWPKALLALLMGISKIYGAIVWLRMWFFRIGVLRRWPLGCQVISVGNVTAGGTGKTPVVEIFARELTKEGRKVAILSRGYRRKEKPFLQRLFSDTIEPPLVVSDMSSISGMARRSRMSGTPRRNCTCASVIPFSSWRTISLVTRLPW